jgi:ubiquinone/menaquinone biosynthesis C-methylase UbiE
MESTEAATFWEANAENWTRLSRAGYDVYRDALNTPAFLAMLPAVAGLDGLDIGCGEGTNTCQLAKLGAHMTAIDIAPTFIRHAQEVEAAEPQGTQFLVGDGTALNFADSSFDFVTAFMSMMDMTDLGCALREVARVLRPGGFLQFSIVHPCFVPPHRKVLRDADGSVTAVEIAGYFDQVDGDVEEWCFNSIPARERQLIEPFRVPRFHRTLSSWVDLIVQAGLAIEQFGEPCAGPALAAAVPYVADTRVAPIFLHIRARKPAA